MDLTFVFKFQYLKSINIKNDPIREHELNL